MMKNGDRRAPTIVVTSHDDSGPGDGIIVPVDSIFMVMMEG